MTLGQNLPTSTRPYDAVEVVTWQELVYICTWSFNARWTLVWMEA